MIGIYKITNPQKEIYICCSTNIDKRFKKYTGKEKNADYFLEMGKCSAFGTADELIKEYFLQSNDFLKDVVKNLIFLEYKRNKKHYLEKEEITIGFKDNKLAFFDGNLKFVSSVF